MAIRKKNIEWRGVVGRFLLISSFVFSIYNPLGFDVILLVKSGALGLWPTLLVLAFYGAICLVLARQTWCGLDPFGRYVPLVLGLGVGVLLWDYSRGAWSWSGTTLVTILLIISAVLTLGQVSAYYIRQAIGQQPVLKQPP